MNSTKNEKKTIGITGASGALGKELTKLFRQKGYKVIGFTHSKTNCYYQVSASRRDLFDKPMFHALMWTAILHAKKLGCRWFETGEQFFQNQPADRPPTQKELGISEFKAGFGGQTRMFLDIRLECSQMKE